MSLLELTTQTANNITETKLAFKKMDKSYLNASTFFIQTFAVYFCSAPFIKSYFEQIANLLRKIGFRAYFFGKQFRLNKGKILFLSKNLYCREQQ